MFYSGDNNVRYKMYKKGKTWIFAGIMTAALTLGIMSSTAHADTTAANTSTVQEEQAVKDVDAVSKVETKVSPETDETATQETQQKKSQSEEGAGPESDVNSTATKDSVKTDQADNNVTGDEKVATATPPVKQSANNDATTNDESVGQADKQVQRLARSVSAPVAIPKNLAKATETIDQWMPNKKLQQVVLLQLRKQNPGKTWNSVADITQDDMTLLTSLVAYGSNESGGIDTYNDRKPFSIEGLQYAVNLTRIEMGTNFNYASRKYYGDIVDISPLTNLTKLQTVNLQQNRIEDTSPLSGLNNVTTLYLMFNAISDFSPLAGHTYQSFTASNQIVFLPTIKIDAKTRKSHLVFQFKNENGEVVPLKERRGIAYPDRLEGTTPTLIYKLYWSGGTSTPDGEGGLYFTNMKDQIPGITNYPGYTIDPLEENFYLTGAVTTEFPGGYSVDIGVIQPYVIGEMAGVVTAHYQDKDGKKLAPDVILDDGFIGDDYTTKAAEIDGYTLMETPVNATGKYTENPVDVYYIYEAKTDPVDPPIEVPDTVVTVTVHYQTSDGKTVAPDQTFTGKKGTAYTTNPVTVEGYTLVETPENASGILGDGDIAVTYIYAPLETDGDGDQVNPETPDTPDTDTAIDDNDNDGDSTGTLPDNVNNQGGSGDQVVIEKTPLINGPANLTSRSTTSAAKMVLPQTGEQHSTVGLWGIVILIGSLLGLAGTKRKEIKKF
ncbi:MucBP domain-containing protein [Levilactobacillus sp. HBUAS70063]|uniref:MucBP domain-containing protein n=1 Tax=Levilactobacillus sp. HBUAS70063 TaxID=3109359 RepID=UPI003132ED3B